MPNQLSPAYFFQKTAKEEATDFRLMVLYAPLLDEVWILSL
jgi:hypothetical protein